MFTGKIHRKRSVTSCLGAMWWTITIVAAGAQVDGSTMRQTARLEHGQANDASEFANQTTAAESEAEVRRLYDSAREAQAAGNLKQARVLLERIKKIRADFEDVDLRLMEVNASLDREMEGEYAAGLAALKEREWVRAIFRFRNVVEIDRHYRDASRRLTAARRGLEQDGEETVMARYYADGVMAMHRSDYGAALAAFERAYRINPEYRNVDSLLTALDALMHSKRRSPGAPMLDTAAKLDSLYRRAAEAEASEDWMEAVVTFEQLQLLRPDYRDVRSRLAEAKARLEDLTAARKDRVVLFVGAAVALLFAVPLAGFAYFSPVSRARIHLWRSDYQAATLVYEKALERDPSRVHLLSKLADIYLQSGRRDENAMKVYRRIAQLNLQTRYRETILSLVTQRRLSDGRRNSNSIGMLENPFQSPPKIQPAFGKQ